MAKRTIRKRMRKSKTICKVMRGCNGRRGRYRHSRTKVGGAVGGKIEAAQYAGASPQANQNLAGGTSNLLAAQQNAGNLPPTAPAPIMSSMAGGARTRHHRRRLRYKKSVARKSRRA